MTTPPTDPFWVRFYLRFATGAAALDVAIGAGILIAWATGVYTPLAAQHQDHVAVRPFSALGLVLGGLSLLLLHHGADRPIARRLAYILAALTAAIGALVLTSYLTGLDLGLSSLLFPDRLAAMPVELPGRPAPQTGVSLLLIGLALLSFRVETRRGRPTEWLMVGAAMVPFVAMLVYAYHLTALYAPFGTLKAATLSIATFSLLLLSLAVAAACPERGWMRHLAGAGPGSVVLRRVLPAFIGVPMLMGVLALIERVTLTTLAASIGIVLLGLTLLEAVLIFRSGLTLNDLDAARAEAQAELAERAEALRVSNERLRAIDRLKTDFVNTVSHELRTPLTSIRGYAEFLEDEIGGPLSSDQRGFVAEIQGNTHRLQRLVDDLLDFAKLEAGTFRLAPSVADLAGIAREVARSMQPVAARAGVTLRYEEPKAPMALTIDAGRIEQVILNMVGNALKFTPKGGQVVIRVAARDGTAWVGIEDTGIGIAPEVVASLFDKFFQVDNTSTRERGGAGLGLAISKALVEAHGGAIGVESVPGKGSTFWFSLPRTEPATAPV